MTFQEYQQAALRTAPTPSYHTEDLLHACAGLTTETGELMDVFKRHEFYGKGIDLTNLKEEAGDLLWYLALLCRFGGFSLEECAEANIAKLRARYPDKFSTERAILRDLTKERQALEYPTT